MSFVIQNNLSAMNAQNNLQVSQSSMQKSLERLSSGYRINSAKDDAAGLAISQGFRANIAAGKVAQRNITEANALLQVAEGAMTNIGDILIRMKELATQAASANVGDDIDKVAAEYNTLVSEIDRIASSTKYAGAALLGGTFGGTGQEKTFQIGYGDTVDDQLEVTLASVKATDLGTGLAIGDLLDSGAAFDAITKIDEAISYLSTERGVVGSYQNRLGYASSNLSSTLENFTAAESAIRDVDMAAEMTNFTKNQILVQAGTAMLAQANAAPQQILSLLKG